MREFRDSYGRGWKVWAVFAGQHTQADAAIDKPHAGGWLCFDCGEERRRFVPLPDGWEDLLDFELGWLCLAAKPVPVRVQTRRPP